MNVVDKLEEEQLESLVLVQELNWRKQKQLEICSKKELLNNSRNETTTNEMTETARKIKLTDMAVVTMKVELCEDGNKSDSRAFSVVQVAGV